MSQCCTALRIADAGQCGHVRRLGAGRGFGEFDHASAGRPVARTVVQSQAGHRQVALEADAIGRERDGVGKMLARLGEAPKLRLAVAHIVVGLGILRVRGDNPLAKPERRLVLLDTLQVLRALCAPTAYGLKAAQFAGNGQCLEALAHPVDSGATPLLAARATTSPWDAPPVTARGAKGQPPQPGRFH